MDGGKETKKKKKEEETTLFRVCCYGNCIPRRGYLRPPGGRGERGEGQRPHLQAVQLFSMSNFLPLQLDGFIPPTPTFFFFCCCVFLGQGGATQTSGSAICSSDAFPPTKPPHLCSCCSVPVHPVQCDVKSGPAICGRRLNVPSCFLANQRSGWCGSEGKMTSCSNLIHH